MSRAGFPANGVQEGLTGLAAQRVLMGEACDGLSPMVFDTTTSRAPAERARIGAVDEPLSDGELIGRELRVARDEVVVGAILRFAGLQVDDHDAATGVLVRRCHRLPGSSSRRLARRGARSRGRPSRADTPLTRSMDLRRPRCRARTPRRRARPARRWWRSPGGRRPRRRRPGRSAAPPARGSHRGARGTPRRGAARGRRSTAPRSRARPTSRRARPSSRRSRPPEPVRAPRAAGCRCRRWET